MSKLVENAPHADITRRIIGAAMAVHNDLGPGHREEVYHRAMAVKMPAPPFNLSFEDKPKLPVYDEQGTLVYTYEPDFIAEQAVIAEIKAQTHPLTDDDIAQVFDYFAASDHKVACSSTSDARALSGSACSRLNTFRHTAAANGASRPNDFPPHTIEFALCHFSNMLPTAPYPFIRCAKHPLTPLNIR